MFKPMLCHDAHGTDVSVIPIGWVMEPKLDGWRWQIERTEDGVKHIGGRNGREYDGPPPITEALMFLPVGTVLDGEIIVADGHSGSVGSAISKGGDGCRFVAFDVLAVSGTDVTHEPWWTRREMLDTIALGFEFGHNLVVATTPVSDVSQSVLNKWIDAGAEGAVCKAPGSRYLPGKRTREWLKLKAVTTADAIVIGFERGKGQSNGHLNAAMLLRMCDTGTETSCGLGSWCEDATANEKNWIGRRVELKCYGRFETGSPRHPVFLRFRDDLESLTGDTLQKA